MEEITKKFAVLIDAENVSSKYVKYILDEISGIGTSTIRRIYGDWSNNTNSWDKKCLLEYSIHPVQQFGYTIGKNATDSAMIIDAMDLLYTGNLDGFCLVSSDSDFTKLAERLRESGKYVIGMGEKKTPTPFRRACTSFKILEVLAKEESNEEENGRTESLDNLPDVTNIKEIKKAVFKIIDENEDKGRETHLGELGNILQNKFSEFDVRNYGYSKLSTFLEEEFEEFVVKKDGKNTFVKVNAENLPKEDIKEMIENILEQNQGKISNLSILNDQLKKEYKHFSAKKYGYSKFSSFVKSFDCFMIQENEIKLKEK